MRTGIVTAALLAVAGGAAVAQTAPPAATPPARPPACQAPEHSQFDFWIGHWDVYATGSERLVGRNLIEKIYGGCTIRENWMPVGGTGGGSLNMYSPVDRRWHQTWQDSANARVEFDGGMAGDTMVLIGYWPGIGGPGKDGWVRMSYSRNADGSVRQLGEQSLDHGRSWSTAFDLTYRKSNSPSSN